MKALYSLYDALISIHVPTDKARAVVDAMEHDMSTILATKADLASTQLLLKQEITGVCDSLRQEINNVRDSLQQEISNVRDSLMHEIENRFGLLSKDIVTLGERTDQKFELLRSSMTVRLGSMLFIAMSLLFAALKLT